MPNWDWQLAAALACVAVASLALVRRVVAFWSARQGGGCSSGGCGSCPANATPPSGLREKPLVRLDAFRPSPGTDGGGGGGESAASKRP